MVSELQQRVLEAAKTVGGKLTITELATGDKKQYDYLTGEYFPKGPISRKKEKRMKYLVDGVEYPTAQSIANEYNISVTKIYNRLKSTKSKWAHWIRL